MHSIAKRLYRPLLVQSTNAVPKPQLLARSSVRFFSGNAVKPARPDYYSVLGITYDATTEQVKAAFREQAKLHHPDVLARRGATESDLEVFKMINDAYVVLSDPAKRREYDSERGIVGGSHIPLRVKNEGIYGGVGPVEVPSSIYEAGPNWGTGLKSTGLSDTLKEAQIVGQVEGKYDRDEALRHSMRRAMERQKDSVRFRAALQRMQRQKIEVPPKSHAFSAFTIPIAVVGIWVVNYCLFM